MARNSGGATGLQRQPEWPLQPTPVERAARNSNRVTAPPTSAPTFAKSHTNDRARRIGCFFFELTLPDRRLTMHLAATCSLVSGSAEFLKGRTRQSP